MNLIDSISTSLLCLRHYLHMANSTHYTAIVGHGFLTWFPNLYAVISLHVYEISIYKSRSSFSRKR